MVRNSDCPGATIMDPSVIFPIFLTVVINEFHLRTLSIRVFLQELKEKFIYKSNIGGRHGPDFATQTWLLHAIFGEKLFSKFSDLTTNC